jgi:hypothetical protein
MALTTAERVGLAVAMAGALAACRTEHPPSRDSASAIGAPGTTSASAMKPACPRTGHWTPCQVKARLQQSGVAPRDSTLDDLPRLGPRPAVYAIGASGLAVYLFPDAAARERAARTLDSTRFVPPSSALSMRQEATVIQNDNLLAVLYSQRDQQRERVSDAFLAGAPQR